MKIAYVTMQFPVPSETFASNDVESLRGLGHDVDLYALRYKHADYKKMMKERGHNTLSVTHFRNMLFWRVLLLVFIKPHLFLFLLCWIFRCCALTPTHLIKSLLLVPSVICVFDEISRNKPDVVHLFWGHYPSMLGFLVSKFYPEIVLTMFLGAHDLVARYPGSTYLAKKCDCIFTHSNANLDAISSLSINVDTVKVVFRGTKLGLESAADSSKFQYMERPILLVASRLVKEKGVDDVLRVFKVILDDYPHAVLQIAGDGAQLSALKDLALELGIDEHVIFLGHINQDLLRAKMTAAHFFVLMSCYQGERLPNAVKEAMYQKCVIITTETIGIEELVTHGADGFVVPMGDYIGASECLQLCIMDPLKALLIAENAHQKIIQSFDINVSMSSYLAIWERHLKAREFSI